MRWWFVGGLLYGRCKELSKLLTTANLSKDYELHEWHEWWMGRKNTTFNVRDYELHEWHECWMGRKHIVLEIEDYELHEWH